MAASRTTPTEFVLVSSTGPSSRPDSSTQGSPVISPLPLSEKCPANTGRFAPSPFPRGRMAVTPVRTLAPSTSVTWPTSTPRTSVIALNGPGVPKSKGMPRSRARGSAAEASAAGRAMIASTWMVRMETSLIRARPSCCARRSRSPGGLRGRNGPAPRPPGPPSFCSKDYTPDVMSWKKAARRDPAGFYRHRTENGEVRIFMTEALLEEMEDDLEKQVANARRFPGVVDVVLTPDAHTGYGVPVGCVMATTGTLAMGPVGYDIGCGIAALRSDVARDRATPDRVREFSTKVMARVGLGKGSKGESVSRDRFQEVLRGGATAVGERRGAAERDRIPVDDDWDVPKDSRAWRGQGQLGSLGGGN